MFVGIIGFIGENEVSESMFPVLVRCVIGGTRGWLVLLIKSWILCTLSLGVRWGICRAILMHVPSRRGRS